MRPQASLGFRCIVPTTKSFRVTSKVRVRSPRRRSCYGRGTCGGGTTTGGGGGAIGEGGGGEIEDDDESLEGVVAGDEGVK